MSTEQHVSAHWETIIWFYNC